MGRWARCGPCRSTFNSVRFVRPLTDALGMSQFEDRTYRSRPALSTDWSNAHIVPARITPGIQACPISESARTGTSDDRRHSRPLSPPVQHTSLPMYLELLDLRVGAQGQRERPIASPMSSLAPDLRSQNQVTVRRLTDAFRARGDYYDIFCASIHDPQGRGLVQKSADGGLLWRHDWMRGLRVCCSGAP